MSVGGRLKEVVPKSTVYRLLIVGGIYVIVSTKRSFAIDPQETEDVSVEGLKNLSWALPILGRLGRPDQPGRTADRNKKGA